MKRAGREPAGNGLSGEMIILMLLDTTYSIFPLGDSAVTLELGTVIDEALSRKALAVAATVRSQPFPGLKDVITAYSSVTIVYDPLTLGAQPGRGGYAYKSGGHPDKSGGQAYKYVVHRLEEALADADTLVSGSVEQRPTIRVPVCYGGLHGPDLAGVARLKSMTEDEVIRLHCSVKYRVYMVGFLPGFPYLGTIDPALQSPRKPRPSMVEAGGVGIAGLQTGIYPVNSPGGWHIIGRTPWKLFDPFATPPIRLMVGDSVEFYPITEIPPHPPL